MHDKRQWAVYYNCCIVIVVVGGGGIFICICLAFVIAKDERDRNVRHVISTTNTNKQCTYHPNATTAAVALSL